MGNDINCAYFYRWIHLIIMKVLRWRIRAYEGEVIGREFKGKAKINILVPPLADTSFVSSHGFGNPGF
jgi:hypothetical protein